ncbi:MAG TPA: hypothetical protein VGW34_10040 [Allosphingosinicella sp.]|nr:hypothetical protein [Allosphingosinicella sp.]
MADEAQTIEALQVEVGRLTAENAELRRSLGAQKGWTTRKGAEAAVLKLEKSPKRRAIGPLKAEADRELISLALASGDVEIVFSDGRHELRDLVPIVVNGDAWRHTARGAMLLPDVTLEPGDIKAPELKVAGFGLLSEGEQIAWCQLPEPITVRRNGRVLLQQQIRF